MTGIPVDRKKKSSKITSDSPTLSPLKKEKNNLR